MFNKNTAESLELKKLNMNFAYFSCLDRSAPPSKNAVSANIKHSRYFH